MRHQLTALLSLFLSASACYKSPETSAPVPATNASTAERVSLATSSTSSTITAVEIQRTSASNLYDAIVQLRPAYFASRGSTSLNNEPEHAIVIVIDGHVIGGISELRNIAAAITKSVRRLSAGDVYQITGISAPAGGIEVVLGR
jgi:hypothetical protein